MTEMTPEAARAAADWLAGTGACPYAIIDKLCAEADRLEAAAITPGERLYADVRPRGAPFWPQLSAWEKATHEVAVSNVIDRHVGADRVVVDRYAALSAVGAMGGKPLLRASVAAFREALS